jgi:N-dimethylarginine dimethylaminohydrolase
MSGSSTFLITDAAHFEVSYKINPWMKPGAWRDNETKNRKRAIEGSAALRRALEEVGAKVVAINGAPGLPDMVFPANAAIVLNRRALLARFRHAERQGEEHYFSRAFEALRREDVIDEVERMPRGCWQEGAGDCVWDDSRQLFWAGHGPRSLPESIDRIKDFFQVKVIPLELISERYYHLDVCFLALSGGEILYYPPAFSNAALATIRDRIPAELLIEASSEDVERFSVNAVNLGFDIVMARPPVRLEAILAERGYKISPVDLQPFMMAGGGAYCMTLRLDLKSRAAPSRTEARRQALMYG